MSIHLREMAHDENMPRGGHLLKDLTGIVILDRFAQAWEVVLPICD